MKPTRSPGAIMGAGALIAAQYILAFFVYKLPGIPAVQYTGWCIWGLSVIFGFAPIFILRGQGGVEKGMSYVKTTRLVDTSLYAVVRHPQYVGGMLFSLALMFIAQHWLIVLLGIASMALIYFRVTTEEQRCIEKFGAEYLRYMQRVPQINFVLGAVRLIQAKGSPDRDKARDHAHH